VPFFQGPFHTYSLGLADWGIVLLAALSVVMVVEVAKAWARRRVRELSRGMQQRVALARALLHRPSVLLLDEPDTGLDEAAFAILKGALEEAAAQGCSVLFTSHNLLRGLSLADRVSILVAGRIAFEARRDGLDPGELEGTYRRLAAAP